MEGFRADPVKWCSRKKTIVESLPLSTSDCAELGDGLATSAVAWAAGLVCCCCELTGSTAKSPITRVVAMWVRMGSPMYFLTALTIIIGAASRSGPFAISSVQLNNKLTRTLIKTEMCFRSYRLQHSTDREDFCQAKQIPTPKDKDSGCDRTQGKIR